MQFPADYAIERSMCHRLIDRRLQRSIGVCMAQPKYYNLVHVIHRYKLLQICWMKLWAALIYPVVHQFSRYGLALIVWLQQWALILVKHNVPLVQSCLPQQERQYWR